MLAFEGGLILQFIVDLPDWQMLPLGEQFVLQVKYK